MKTLVSSIRSLLQEIKFPHRVSRDNVLFDMVESALDGKADAAALKFLKEKLGASGADFLKISAVAEEMYLDGFFYELETDEYRSFQEMKGYGQQECVVVIYQAVGNDNERFESIIDAHYRIADQGKERDSGGFLYRVNTVCVAPGLLVDFRLYEDEYWD